MAVLLANQLCTWDSVLPEEITGPQLARNFQYFMEPESSFPHLFPYPEVQILGVTALN